MFYRNYVPKHLVWIFSTRVKTRKQDNKKIRIQEKKNEKLTCSSGTVTLHWTLSSPSDGTSRELLEGRQVRLREAILTVDGRMVTMEVRIRGIPSPLSPL